MPAATLTRRTRTPTLTIRCGRGRTRFSSSPRKIPPPPCPGLSRRSRSFRSRASEPGLHPWFLWHAQALVQADRADDAESLVDWIEERAIRLERRWALAMCAHMRGSIAAARGNLESAQRELAGARTA